VRRFLGHFGHPDGIVCGVEIVERDGIHVELVPQHEDQVSQISHARPCCHGIRVRVVASAMRVR